MFKYKNELTEYFSKFTKVTNTSVKKYFKICDSNIRDYILNYLNEHPNWETAQYLIIGILNNIELSKCRYCNKELTYSKRDQHYCSKECLKKSGQVAKSYKSTCLKKYGVDNVSKLEKIKEKHKNTCIEKYGVDNPAKNEFIKNKIKNTNLKKYGVECTLQNEDIKKRIIEKNLKNIGFKSQLKKSRWNKILSWHKFDIIPMFDKEFFNNSNKNTIFKWKCLKCGNEFEQTIHSTGHFKTDDKVPRCMKCYPFLSGFSKEEKELSEFCRAYFPNLIENTKKLINPYELDIYIPELKLGIEFNGVYWHSTNLGISKDYHIKKTELCEEKGIRLIHIFEYQWLYQKDQIKEKLKAIFNIDQISIGARTCTIKEISTKEKSEFLNKNHIQGNDQSTVKLGLINNNELVAVMTFGKPRFNKKYDWELIRYASKSGYRIIGGAGKLLKYFEKNYNPKNIITYADRCWSQGNMYKKLNFSFIGKSDPGYFYIKDNMYISRYKAQKNKLKKLLGEKFNPELSEYENMYKNDYFQIFNCGNLIFEKKY